MFGVGQAETPGIESLISSKGGKVLLCMTIVSYHKITPGQRHAITLGTGVMTIGRNRENDWVISDSERLVSSRHCVIQYRNGHYYLTDNSTNGVELANAGIRMRRGNSELLEDGELIRIGDYEILVRIDDTSTPSDFVHSHNDSARGVEALMRSQNQAAAGLGEISQASHSQRGVAQDTFPDLFDFLAPGKVLPATQSDHVPVEQHDFSPPVPQPAATSDNRPMTVGLQDVIPEDWDLRNDGPVASDTTPVAQGESMNEIAPQPVMSSPDELFVERVIDESCGDHADLIKAFLRGAGLGRLLIEPTPGPLQMEAIGRSYRLMVQGLIDALRARSSLKSEFRMQQTLVQPVENNPLKFAPNADEALLLLLRDGSQAFMPPDQAIADGFDDLHAHQLALMAGVEGAIKGLLKRFEPAELEARMGKPGAFTQLLGSRQARYWRQFTKLYAQISHEAEEDFQILFGREFSRAYEEQSVRMRRP
jgi:type VI secretion system protein